MLPWRVTLGGVRLLAAGSALPGSLGTSPRCSLRSGTDPTQRRGCAEHDKRGFSCLVGAAGLIASGLGIVWYIRWKERSSHDQSVSGVPFPQLSVSFCSGEADAVSKLSIRECRYKEFSSLSFNGQLYMTPRDFLESITCNKPRMRERQYVNESDLKTLLKKTLPRSKGSKHLFRDMWNDGILTYADYLFLLTALVKTTRQFEIAFKMIDADSNDFIDSSEFSKVQKVVTTQKDRAFIQRNLANSTLSIHLFGQKGNQNLYSKDFYQFIENLQTEVLEIEFNKYAGGSPTINEEDFARILLRHTAWDMELVFERLGRKQESYYVGVSFQQFCDFCQLLNCLEDFEIAMIMFTIAGCSVNEEEFGRAARVCLGKPLDRSIVSTVFNIFDVDGDGKLSYKEFVSVMKSWKLRGLKMREQLLISGWSEFKTCLGREMKDR